MNTTTIRDTDKTDCEVCSYKYDFQTWRDSGQKNELGQCKLFMTMIMCPSCLVRETQAQVESSLNSEMRVLESNAQTLIDKSLAIDHSIQVSQDIFNAKTISINELKIAIDTDESIPSDGKHFLLAQTLESRFKNLVSVISGLQDKQKELQSEQRAIQTYYNELSKKLREDERAQIKLKSVNYQPPVKPIKSQKAPSIKNYDRNAVKDAARLSKLPEAAIQMICIARNISAVEAVRVLQESMNANKSE